MANTRMYGSCEYEFSGDKSDMTLTIRPVKGNRGIIYGLLNPDEIPYYEEEREAFFRSQPNRPDNQYSWWWSRGLVPHVKRIHIEGEIEAHGDLSQMFAGFKSLTDISDLKKMDVNFAHNMSGMFQDCESLADLSAVSEWDMSNVEDISYMFRGCQSLADITALSKWNTEYIKNMNAVFAGCFSLADITPLADWKTLHTKEMGSMFCGTSISDVSPLSKWKVNRVETMEDMFRGCSSLKNIAAISDWKVSRVENIRRMFYGCQSLTDISPLSKWDVSGVELYTDIFSNCKSLSDISVVDKWMDIPDLDVELMFNNCPLVEDNVLAKKVDMIRNNDKDISIILVRKKEIAEKIGPVEASVNARYGDKYIEGTRITLTDHNIHPEKDVPFTKGVILLSNNDINSLGGIMEIKGNRPDDPEFWKAAAFIEDNGHSYIHTFPEEIRDKLYAFYSLHSIKSITPEYFSASRYMIEDYTEYAEREEKTLSIIFDKNHPEHDEIIEKGREWGKWQIDNCEKALICETDYVRAFFKTDVHFDYNKGYSNYKQRLFDTMSLYSQEDNEVKKASVVFTVPENTRDGEIRIDIMFADGGDLNGMKNACALMQHLYGREANIEGTAGFACYLPKNGTPVTKENIITTIMRVEEAISPVTTIERLDEIRDITKFVKENVEKSLGRHKIATIDRDNQQKGR